VFVFTKISSSSWLAKEQGIMCVSTKCYGVAVT